MGRTVGREGEEGNHDRRRKAFHLHYKLAMTTNSRLPERVKGREDPLGRGREGRDDDSILRQRVLQRVLGGRGTRFNEAFRKDASKDRSEAHVVDGRR